MTGHGVAAWSAPGWRAAAVAWLDERLAAAGLARTGEVSQPRVRPWATVLTAPTTGGPVWLKATAPSTAFELGIYELLARVAPERILLPLATDRARGWMLLPDGGPTFGDRRLGPDALVAALVEYGRLQRALAPRVGELLGAGVPDMRPAAMPGRFEAALAAADGDAELRARIAARRPVVAKWCERLAASPLPPSLDHNDLHPWNLLGEPASVRFYDWGDSVVAHPFAAMLVPLSLARGAGALDRARDAYLEVFADVAPHAELVETLEVACQVAKIARALTWERAIASARDQDEPIDDDLASAPLETLAWLLDDDYLGE